MSSKCQHPPDQVVADILQADALPTRVRWCRICGAYSVSHNTGWTAWEAPLGRALAPIGDRA